VHGRAGHPIDAVTVGRVNAGCPTKGRARPVAAGSENSFALGYVAFVSSLFAAGKFACV